MYVSNLSASGIITSVFEYDGDDYFVIDGKAYRASKSYYNTCNGGNVYCLTGYSKGRKISLEFLPDADNLPKKGDVIQYAQNPDKKITLYNTLCNYETADFEKNTFLDDISYSKCNTIETVNDGIITVNRQGNYVNYYTDNNTVVYNIENSDRNNISVGSADDITNGDRIFIILKEGIADEITQFIRRNTD